MLWDQKVAEVGQPGRRPAGQAAHQGASCRAQDQPAGEPNRCSEER